MDVWCGVGICRGECAGGLGPVLAGKMSERGGQGGRERGCGVTVREREMRCKIC